MDLATRQAAAHHTGGPPEGVKPCLLIDTKWAPGTSTNRGEKMLPSVLEYFKSGSRTRSRVPVPRPAPEPMFRRTWRAG